MKEPRLKNYIYRLELDKKLLETSMEKRPQMKEVLEERIKDHEKHILEIVTSDRFKNMLDYLNV